MTEEYNKHDENSKIVSLEELTKERLKDRGVVSAIPDIDLDAIRISQDYGAELGARKALTTVSVRKPNRQSFVRTHPDPLYRIETIILEFEETRETYLVGPQARGELASEIVPKLLTTAIDRQGVVFLWPITLPDASGRHSPWHQSALEAARRAEGSWIRVASNMTLGAYEIFVAIGPLDDPQWPEESFQELLELAFKDRYIDSLDHPVIHQLRGRV